MIAGDPRSRIDAGAPLSYQVVNDKGLDTTKDGIRFQGNTEVTARDISSSSAASRESRSVASWKYFRSAGFILNALDRSVTARPGRRPAAMVHLGVSANPSI